MLVTNDDGIAAPGLHALAAAAVAAGLAVLVAAPAEEASGSGSSIIAVRRDGLVPLQPRELPGLDAVPAYAVAAQPAFISSAALNGWFDPPPSLVLSGINYGANLSDAVMHSGTVGAALTAGRLGARALAVSLDCDHRPEGEPVRWDAAAALVPAVLEVLTATEVGTVLSLNVPNLPPRQLGELKAATLASRSSWRPRISQVEGGLWVRGIRASETPEPGSDVALLAAGHPTVTLMQPVASASPASWEELLARSVSRPRAAAATIEHRAG
ncbi:MAG: 5'/3'-nucleotidase SurE [Pseudonocardia sp.]|nr:5'/3'-nucleotidase SurE [Pseudonocardia sp.]